ncbi:hypothetical protein MROS_1239 [Melioribacter roseus P3M-2]|uniref:Uncharacterized protein n=1 Tax=Melioribacter roseus (strain DSM 23840 / JCM 17771 / VKM B-2668 / P3M-2) TaxID=1191523 RepID=I7A3L6_MELRP|nr:hypothetical protein [Melioribacter roseus]AFN74476.1 hypothetical protein MROS_1239 [Melioribacter roseus P3M-2]
MSKTMKKLVDDVITSLKKLPEPGKRSGSFWDFMKSQLTEEGEWEQKHINTIEKEIDKFLSKLDKKNIEELWESTPAAEDSLGAKPSVKQMKSDITDELVGQVMDRMDENYSKRDTFFSEDDEYISADDDEKADSEDEPPLVDIDNVDLDDEDIDIDDLFGDDFEDDEELY